MSIVPKINIGKPKDRDKFTVNSDCSTTANIGQVQPIFSRELMPNEDLKIRGKSFVRLSTLPVPTFGRVSLRHYHIFVPYQECWDRFNSFITGQTTQTEGNSGFVPEMSYFSNVAQVFLNYSDVSVYKKNTNWSKPHLSLKDTYDLMDIDSTNASTITAMNTALACMYTQGNNAIALTNHHLLFNDKSAPWVNLNKGISLKPDDQGCLVAPSGFAFIDSDHTAVVAALPGSSQVVIQNNDNGNNNKVINPVNLENADFTIMFSDNGEGRDSTTYIAAFRLKPIAKRFRTVCIGLGYPASVYYTSTKKFNPLKFIAFYKAWFSLFAPIREKNFEQTACYSLQQYLHNHTNIDLLGRGEWALFLKELLDISYYLPMDYFSMATSTVQQSNSDVQLTFSSILGSEFNTLKQLSVSDSLNPIYGSVNGVSTNYKDAIIGNVQYSRVNPLFFKVAQQFLRYANKNTVIGRSIRDYLKVHFGVVDEDVRKVNGVELVGTDRVPIIIDEVVSKTQNEDVLLGEYGGIGRGFKDEKNIPTFKYHTQEFGVYIILSVIVPESGYYQGYLHENGNIDRYDFPTPEFDALDYEVVERGELNDSYTSNVAPTLLDPETYQRDGAFGFVPRYSYHKVGRNIVNGDLSLPSTQSQMSSYTLDRKFPTQPNFVTNRLFGYQEGWMPTVVSDSFRKLDLSDKFGNYNRIFTYTGPDLDHFIIHNYIDVDCISPLKSISNSFDSYTKDDDAVTDITHS